jgi:hypothetical protein
MSARRKNNTIVRLKNSVAKKVQDENSSESLCVAINEYVENSIKVSPDKISELENTAILYGVTSEKLLDQILEKLFSDLDWYRKL